ncbi:MAG: T9SS type A sorting domain-containing protein [Bacteroidetes bacterium]|nr:T9SS type A sorting domain-containing protein [Bacteroidota bacterium]
MAAYSVASIAFVAIHEDAQAFVVYNDLDPDSLVLGNDTIFLDIDGDGINDIRFWIESKISSIESSGGLMVPYQYRFAYGQGISVNAILGKQNTLSSYVINSAYIFESGDLIADTIPKFTAKARLAGFISVDGSVVYEGGPWSGTDNSYLGIRFKISGATHFAWIRLSVAEGGSSIQLNALAWDNQVDAGIVAGTTVGIAENPELTAINIFSNQTSIIIQSEEFLENATCNVVDISGREIYTASISGYKNEIPAQTFPSGIYIVVIESKNHFIQKNMAEQIIYCVICKSIKNLNKNNN